MWIWGPDMEFENQIQHDAIEPAHYLTAETSAPPAQCQAHEKPHYRELPPGFTLAMLLAEMEKAILRGEQLIPSDLDTLKKVVRVVRSIMKPDTLEVEL